MANRSTRFILKNNTNSAAPFSGATLLVGEPIVNTAAGIMMFSGVTSGTNDWVPAGAGANGNFFEVGSNLYNLKIRNKITEYSGITNLSGKFLSGTTDGFVLADISGISSVDSYVTGFSYNNNVLTINQNNGQPNLTALIDVMSGLTINGVLSATTMSADTIYAGDFPQLPFTDNETVEVYSASGNTFLRVKDVVSAPSGGTRVFVGNIGITSGLTVSGAVSSTSISATTYLNLPVDIHVTGGTINYVNSDGTTTFTNSTGGTFNVTGFKDVFTTGGTYNAGTATFTKNDGTTYQLSGLSSTDTYVTGFTYNPTSNLITLSQNQGQTDKTLNITTVSGLTLSNLTAGRVVYVGSGGLLTDEAGFTYDDGTNTFSVPSDGTMNVGTGGLNVTGDAVIQGSLTVFGPSVSAFTSQLYVEDDNITLNYNPTGSTTATSIGAGWSIQDGSGIANTATTLNIGVSYLNPNFSPNTEYTAATGNENRNFYSPIGDIVIRNTNGDSNAPNGVRVLAEGDILSGGFY